MSREQVTVLLLFGDDAELITPDRDHTNPLRVPASVIAEDAGLPANELPGRDFTAVRTADGGYAHFQLVNDPRI